MEGTTISRQAEGKLAMATARLLERFPFHVAILERLKAVPQPSVGTMGVTVASGEVLLLHNPAFVMDTHMDELSGVLLHEVHHVLFNHILANPADYPDDWARTVAQEITANEFVHLPLPGNPIVLEQFPGLPEMEGTDDRYRRLKRRSSRFPLASPQHDVEDSGSDSGSSGTPTPSRGSDAKSPFQTKDGEPGSGTKHGLGTIDDHRVWQTAREDLDGSKAAVKDLIEEAVFAAGWENVPEEVRPELEALGIGQSPGTGQQQIGRDRKGTQDWRKHLRRHVGRLLEVRPIFTRPPRRFPELVGIVPGRGRRAVKPKIMAVLDTSQSITEELLERINNELADMARHFSITVVECDAQIQAVYPYEPITSVAGRGGTDLRPPFVGEFLREHRPDVIIYFTDGDGPAPDGAPRMPVIWCLVPGGKPPARWGKVIYIDGGSES